MAVLVNVPSVLNVFLMGSGATGDRRGVEDASVDRGCEVDGVIGDVAKYRVVLARRKNTCRWQWDGRNWGQWSGQRERRWSIEGNPCGERGKYG